MIDKLHTAKIDIRPVKVAVVGDPGVGKTCLIQAFKDEPYQENPPQNDTETSKMFYDCDQRYLFSMLELHDDWDKVCHNMFDIEAVLLCYEGGQQQEERLALKWTGKVAEYLSKARLYVVRTKCDQHDNGDGGSSPEEVALVLNAVKAYECSAKDKIGVTTILMELARVPDDLFPEPKEVPQECEADEAVKQGFASIGMMAALGNSLPLIKQTGRNVKEIVFNPDCYPAVKESINQRFPILFPTRPSYDHNRISEENKLKEEYEAQCRLEGVKTGQMSKNGGGGCGGSSPEASKRGSKVVNEEGSERTDGADSKAAGKQEEYEEQCRLEGVKMREMSKNGGVGSGGSSPEASKEVNEEGSERTDGLDSKAARKQVNTDVKPVENATQQLPL